MLAKRHIIRTALVLLGLVLLVFSCKKLDKDNPISFTIKAHIPYSGEPISGVKYTIREYRSKKFSTKMGDTEYTDFELSGQTDQNGNALISFLPKKNLDYQYEIYFDYSSLQFQSYTGSFTLIHPPSFDRVERSYQENYDIRALPHCGAHFKVENVNCFDANDKMRFKTFNMDEFPNQSLQYIPDFNNYFTGCGLLIDHTNSSVLSGRHLYQIEVTRNNVVTTYVDTFFLQPGIMNEVFLEY